MNKKEYVRIYEEGTFRFLIRYGFYLLLGVLSFASIIYLYNVFILSGKVNLIEQLINASVLYGLLLTAFLAGSPFIWHYIKKLNQL